MIVASGEILHVRYIKSKLFTLTPQAFTPLLWRFTFMLKHKYSSSRMLVIVLRKEERERSTPSVRHQRPYSVAPDALEMRIVGLSLI